MGRKVVCLVGCRVVGLIGLLVLVDCLLGLADWLNG